MSLIKYLKQFIEYVDVQKIHTMVIDFGKNRRVNNTEEKNRLLVSMFLLLVSEKSVMIRTYLGGYTVRFLDFNLGQIKRSMEKLSKQHIETIQKRANLCKITQNKSIEILFSKMYPNRGYYESGELFSLPKIAIETPYTFGKLGNQPKADSKSPTFKDIGSFQGGLGVPVARSQNKKSSMQIKNMDSESADGEPPQQPPFLDLRRLLVREPESHFIADEGEQESQVPETSRRSVHSPALKDRFSKIAALTSSLLPFDELAGLLEDDRTAMAGLYLARHAKGGSPMAKAMSARSLRAAPDTYPKIFRLNPTVATLVLKDKSLGKARPFVAASVGLQLPAFDAVACAVDLADRNLARSQRSPVLSINSFAKACRVDQDLLAEACTAAKRGGKLKQSLKLELVLQLAAGVEARNGLVVAKYGDAPLVEYLPALADDLMPPKVRVLNTLAKGIARLSNLKAHPKVSPLNKIQIVGFKHGDNQTKRRTIMARHSMISPRKRMILVIEENLPEIPKNYKIKLNNNVIYLNISYTKEASQFALLLKFYNPDFSEPTVLKVTSPVEINRICSMMQAGSKELQETAFGFLLNHQKSWIGTKPVVIPRKMILEKQSIDSLAYDKMMDLLWRNDSQRDLLAAFDVAEYSVLLGTAGQGRQAARCRLFFSFRARAACLCVDVAATGQRHAMLKLVLASDDVRKHVHADILQIVFDRGAVIKCVQAFLAKVVFERAMLYSRPMVVHKRSSAGHIMSAFVNVFRRDKGKASFLEFKKIQREVISQFVFRLRKLYMVVTVFRHRSAKQHDIELYCPKTQKRFYFEMFNDELLRMDQIIVNKIYQLSSSEIMFLAETSNFDYRALLSAIRKNIVNFKLLSHN
jgi:hypothetical protein